MDAAYVNRQGLLVPGQAFSLRWKNALEEEVASAWFMVRGDASSQRAVSLELIDPPGGDDIPLTSTLPYFGGLRWWFLCPRCGQRVAKLHLVADFACRACHRLSYQSQRQSRPEDRALARLQKIRRRLGGSGSLWEDFPERPRGMPVPTYARLLLEARDLQNELIDPHRAWSRQVRALLEKLESSS